MTGSAGEKTGRRRSEPWKSFGYAACGCQITVFGSDAGAYLRRYSGAGCKNRREGFGEADSPELNDAYKEYLAAKAYYAFVMKYRNYKNIVNTQNAAKPMVATDINLFDAQENYLNTPESTYDLKKGIEGARAHNSADLLTKITNVSPGIRKRLVENALQVFFCKDQDLIDYVQETVGLAAIGKVYEEAHHCVWEGRNGKSTFWNTVSRVLGTYSGAISADALTAGCRRNVKPEIAELKESVSSSRRSWKKG